MMIFRVIFAFLYAQNQLMNKFQRIEAESFFGGSGKAESCHLMSREHCKKYGSYLKYDNDKSNRLALSREFHGFYDGLNIKIPFVNISVVNISKQKVTGDRYSVTLKITVLNAGCKEMIFSRLKPGSAIVPEDDLAMTTTVLILNPTVFKKCINWKFKQIQKLWDSFSGESTILPFSI